MLVLSVILTMVTAFPLPASFKQQVGDSALARPLLAFAGIFDRLIGPALQPLADAHVNLLTVKPESEDRVELNFTVPDGKVDMASEEDMLARINAERQKRGLNALVMDPKLRTAARAYGRTMFEGGYFSHISPDGTTPPERLIHSGVIFVTMAENLALAPDVMIAHDGLMESPGHRANILGADFRKIGIGVIDGDVFGKMFVQEFTN
jgi:uncharacterized protein YkwD